MRLKREKTRAGKREDRKKPLCLSLGLFLGVIFVFACVTVSFAVQDAKGSYEGHKIKKMLFFDKEVQDLLDTQKAKKKYIYNPAGKTDPFKPFIAEEESSEEKKKRKPKTYLETLDISQFELVATIIGEDENWAMVCDSKGLGYVIRKGTLIGLNMGVVREIKADEVIIRETYKGFRGKLDFKDIIKKLAARE